ncbi:MAG: 16S rRNA (cytidine(1402)-2'-O)-methyltransferase [Aquiluna sp.]|nr:16S rRNA (cytidine(1402)-2'-O)-methyltransferase [Aquiluna sp.]
MLILAATPIGNLGDASKRLIELLGSANHIAAEDTRELKKLASKLEIKLHAKLYSLHEHNESDRLIQLVELAKTQDVVVVSDAGMPTVSDPGFLLVRECIANEVEVSVVPGPSAVLAALAVSGLATDRFSFEGFLPRKQGERRSAFEALKKDQRTLIFFEAPHRILDSLTDALSVLGDRPASVSRELTKKFEHTERGPLSSLIEWAKTEPKGEMVLVVSGALDSEPDYDQLGREALDLKEQGLGLKKAAQLLAQQHNASSSAIYERALALKP